MMLQEGEGERDLQQDRGVCVFVNDRERKKLKEKFGKDINTKAEMFSENSSDKKFIQKTIDVIEKNML